MTGDRGEVQDIAVIIGMPRAGTTWLYENFKKHPNIGLSHYKEINRYFFDMSDQSYLDYFKGCDQKIKIDISPLYFFDRQVLGKIAAKHRKCILVLRDEREWRVSLNAQIQKYHGNVEEMVQSGQYVFPVSQDKFLHFDMNAYNQAQYVESIVSLFGDSLRVLPFSLLESDPLAFLKKVEAFLEVKNFFTKENIVDAKVNASNQPLSKIYAFLLHAKLLDSLIPIAVQILPRPFVEWMRRKFVYGDYLSKKDATK